MSWQEHIHTDPEVLAGKPVIRNTRLAVDFLLSLFAAGWTQEQVLQSYPGQRIKYVKADHSSNRVFGLGVRWPLR